MIYEIKVATQNELQIILDWAKNEGWNPGIHDDVGFRIADPSGFFIGYLNNEPISSLSAVRYSNQFGFIGLYLVKPSYRHQGYGIQIWNHGMQYLNNVNIIGLDGVLAQQENYKKFGFKLIHRNIRFSGIAPNIKNTIYLTSLIDIPLETILLYEHNLFPCSRSLFLKSWINHAEEALGFVQKDKLLGYGTMRKCIEGYKIGPLFADNNEIAEQILLGLTNKIKGQKIFLDVPEPNDAAIKLSEHFNMKPIFETARMYTNSDPKINLAKIFGITTFELG